MPRDVTASIQSADPAAQVHFVALSKSDPVHGVVAVMTNFAVTVMLVCSQEDFPDQEGTEERISLCYFWNHCPYVDR